MHAFCFENSAKKSLFHWDAGPKPVLIKEYRLQQEEAQSGRFPLPLDCDHGGRSILGGFFRERVKSVSKLVNWVKNQGGRKSALEMECAVSAEEP